MANSSLSGPLRLLDHLLDHILCLLADGHRLFRHGRFCRGQDFAGGIQLQQSAIARHENRAILRHANGPGLDLQRQCLQQLPGGRNRRRMPGAFFGPGLIWRENTPKDCLRRFRQKFFSAPGLLPVPNLNSGRPSLQDGFHAAFFLPCCRRGPLFRIVTAHHGCGLRRLLAGWPPCWLTAPFQTRCRHQRDRDHPSCI